MRVLILALLCLVPASVLAQSPSGSSPATGTATAASGQSQAAPTEDQPTGIQDNSFLVEEAYNQEPGVIQHISSFQRMHDSGDWVYTFTQEWPVPGQTHQLSVTVPYLRIATDEGSGSGVGDVLLNYRYQLVGNGRARVAVAPRFSFVLPTGNERAGRGTGTLGYQVNLPASLVLSHAFVLHLNGGLTLTPGSQDVAGHKADTRIWSLGQSIVWLARPTFNVLLESAYNSGDQVVGAGTTEAFRSWFLNPGVRGAFNFRNGLQIVPGLSVPIGVGPSGGEWGVLLYLSFEHPLWRAK